MKEELVGECIEWAGLSGARQSKSHRPARAEQREACSGFDVLAGLGLCFDGKARLRIDGEEHQSVSGSSPVLVAGLDAMTHAMSHGMSHGRNWRVAACRGCERGFEAHGLGSESCWQRDQVDTLQSETVGRPGILQHPFGDETQPQPLSPVCDCLCVIPVLPPHAWCCIAENINHRSRRSVVVSFVDNRGFSC